MNIRWQKKDFDKTLDVLRNGGVILYPTDTIWGLGCDATNQTAVSRIYEIKKRADSKSMLTLVDQAGRLDSYLEEVPELAYDLIEMSEKPLTIIYPGAKNIAKNLLAEDGSIGMRVANDKFCQSLVQRLRKPIVSTSANFSGEPSPCSYMEIDDELKGLVDYVVEYRQDDNEETMPSSIIKLGVGGEVVVIRE